MMNEEDNKSFETDSNDIQEEIVDLTEETNVTDSEIITEEEPVTSPLKNDERVVYVPVKQAQKEEHKKPSLFMVIMMCALVVSIIFGAFQSVYIFRLTSGQVGVRTYLNGKEETKTPASNNKPVDSNYTNPHFSIEEASSATDPNKKTLTTMEIVDLVSPATVSVYILDKNDEGQPISSGSGFIISEDGYVVTNEHVIEAALEDQYEVMVILADSETPISAEIVGSDVQTDVAVIKLTERDEGYPTVKLGSSDVLRQGELVVAIGNPLGTLSGTVTVGVVSALGRQFNNNGYTSTLIQTDASINHGNSGGPLINSFGEVIGITNAKMGASEGLGFAIPIDDVKSVIESLITYGYVANRPWFGISVKTEYDNAFYGAAEGVYVAEIVEDGPGDKAGFKLGDKLITMDGIEIHESSDIILVRDNHQVGDTIEIVVLRDGKEVTLELIVGDSYLDR